MAFLDKLGEVAKNMTEKAGDSLEINRLNGEISIEKGNIQCYHRELGEYYWSKYAVGVKLDEEAMLICDKVIVSQERIRALGEEIEQVKKNREAAVAERTEAKQRAEETTAENTTAEAVEPEDTERPTEAAPLFCTNCGGAIKPEQRFCMFCGRPVE